MEGVGQQGREKKVTRNELSKKGKRHTEFTERNGMQNDGEGREKRSNCYAVI